MKGLMLIILAIYFSTATLAQKIHFTDTSNVWKELGIFSTGGPVDFQYSTYTFIQDTTIDSIHYKRFNFESGYGGGSCSFFREDTILKKVYVRQYHFDTIRDTDIVLMDYNLNVGDTFSGSYFDTIYKFRYVVAGIDSTLINSVWHKVWHFSRDLGGYYSYWCDVVEGIGCIQNPTYMLEPIGVRGEYSYYMYCFSNSGTTPLLSPRVSFLDNSSSCNTFPHLNTNQMRLNVEKITIYPNPTTNRITISTSDRITTVAINNLMGQTIYSQLYNSPEVKIDVADLPTGMYFIKINGSEVSKFVKQ